ncbi:lipase maturation factor 2-like [Clupea harengus]|uniref:Lipase maturation factor n=1 Tax=Clupea harengus TaxID=7950 RepID=A0A6P8GUS2_CLUHA|nr:lipase maturation factor 2-like [Clupea harengus]
MGEIGLPRCMFLWSVAGIYLFAFASLYVQIPGLYGNEGIVPVRLVVPPSDRPLLDQLKASPTLLVLGPQLGLDPQQAMELVCLLGALLALGAVLLRPLRNSVVFLCLWALYFSLCQVGQDFLQCQWDSLLLEAGFLAVVVAPLLCGGSSLKLHDPLTFWLTRWLLFRVTFGAGVAKLARGDSEWWSLSALSHHFESQASPNPLSWYCHQLPGWLLKLGGVLQLEAELIAPFLFFAPVRCLRLAAFYLQVLLQLGSLLTGNLSIMGLLTIALCFSLLDDNHVGAWQGHKTKKQSKALMQTIGSLVSLLLALGVFALMIYSAVELFQLRVDWEQKIVLSKTKFTQQQFADVLKFITVPSIWVGVLSLTWEVVAAMLGCVCARGVLSKLWALLQWAIFSAVAAAIFALTLVPYTAMEGVSNSKIMTEVRKVYNLVEPYGLVSAYGVDHKALKEDGRPEIIIEGSMDQQKWTAIEFMYKPGQVERAPALVSPYQPRLDWQLWEVAQGPQDSPWFTGLVQRLLQGKKDVVRLIQLDEAQYPFSQSPPTFIRAGLYKYWFTETSQDGAQPQHWWRRHFVEEFYPAVQLGDPELERMLRVHGLKEKHPAQPLSGSLVSQALVLVRGHVCTLSGPLVLLALIATVASVCLVRSIMGQKGRGAAAAPEAKSKKAKDPQPTAEKNKGKKESSEDRTQDSDRSPRKRRK